MTEITSDQMLRDLIRVANAWEQRALKAEAERDEARALLATYQAENGCTRGQRTTQWCAEVARFAAENARLRRAWLRVIQAENSCNATGQPCDALRCGCAAEQEMLIREAAEARAALTGGADNG